MNKNIRHCGILLHPTSLYGQMGVGSLGKEARSFVDFLVQAEMRYWQILPLGPVGYGNSPYASLSSFAGNEVLISVEELLQQGLLGEDELPTTQFAQERVDFNHVAPIKKILLQKAALRFIKERRIEEQAYLDFCRKESYYIDDWALYSALSDYFNDTRWFSAWTKGLALREESELQRWRKKLAVEIEQKRVIQFFFDRQWRALRRYANAKGIALIGDMPIYVAHDSADAWCNRHYLKLDAMGNLKSQTGVPPDAFSTTGQLWGTPPYNWQEVAKDDFSWWKQRFTKAFEMTDYVRIDHFRGLEAYWEVPADEVTAQNGSWVKAPGRELFQALRSHFGELPLIAEDLGFITSAVEELRVANNFPSTKVLQFGFGFDSNGRFMAENFYLPHNYEPNVVAYSGTHDNDTSRGWYEKLDERHKDCVRRYLACSDSEVVWHMVRALFISSANTVIIPWQDLLNLGTEHRMNIPGTCGEHNWAYRMLAEDLSPQLADATAQLLQLYGRQRTQVFQRVDIE